MGSVKSNSPKRELQLEREGSLLAQIAGLTSPTAYATTYGTHGIHPYPAKYIPQLPNLIIREHTNERSTVLDPFCGSGTTLLEAALLGRKSIGVDSNPIAALVSRVKTTALSEEQLNAASLVLEDVLGLGRRGVPRWVPDGTGVDLKHWFSPAAMKALGVLRYRIDQVQDEVVREVLACAFSKIVVWASNQESETRYAAVEKERTVHEILSAFQKRAYSILSQLREVSESSKFSRNRPAVHCVDIKELSKDASLKAIADLVVTSPPYPNSFDYYLYHKWRMVWLGYDYRKVMAEEIGSRREHSSLGAPISAYVEKMHGALTSVSHMLKPAKLAYFLVGDAVINGEFVDISKVFDDITNGLPLKRIADTKYSLESVSRSFREKSSSSHGGGRNAAKMQHVLVYERIGDDLGNKRPKAKAQANGVPVVDVGSKIKTGSTIAIRSDDGDRHIHSLGRYPSKFVPAVPRWAIAEFTNADGIILDPFVGSGTTAVEAMLAGRKVIASDFSPYACLLTSAKISLLAPLKLKRISDKLVSDVDEKAKKIRPVKVEIPLANFWFPQRELDTILRLRALVEGIEGDEYRNLFLAVLSTCIRSASYQDAGQIKVKRDPKKVLSGVPDPAQLFKKAIGNYTERKLEFLRRMSNSGGFSRVVQSSADNLSKFVRKGEAIDLIVTSPPYINAMNYPMTHRLESFVLGLVGAEEKIQHEAGYIGTERVRASAYRQLMAFKGEVGYEAEVNRLLAEIYIGEPKRSFVVYEYFRRMRDFLRQSSEVLKGGGHLVLVAGRNTIKGVPVPTVEILAAMAAEFGFGVDRWFDYVIVKNALKFTRNETARMIDTDGVFVLRKR